MYTRLLHLLDYFDADHPDAGVTELATYSGMLKSSVHNILQTFELCGFVTQDSETSRYLLGSAAVSLFSRYKETRRLDYRITEYLQGLRDQFRKDVYFAARDQDDAVCLSAELAQPSAASWSKAGARTPLHATSLGKVLLGYATVEQKQAYCAQELAACTPQTITDGGELAAALERIIYDGCATSDWALWRAPLTPRHPQMSHPHPLRPASRPPREPPAPFRLCRPRAGRRSG